MVSEKRVKNVLLLALGDHGMKLAVLLNEKIAEEKEKSQVDLKVNSQILAIDHYWQSNFDVSFDNFLSIIYPYHSIAEAWAEFQKTRQLKGYPEEPWMYVGRPPTIVRTSGLRHADLNLLVHLARYRIYKKIREILIKSFPKSNNSQPTISVVILGSLAGMTSSASYTPVLKILETLNGEFDIGPSFSFLFTPQAFQKAYLGASKNLNIFSFFFSTNEIHDYFRGYKEAFKPTQFLVDTLEDCLIGRQDKLVEFRCNCELITNIMNFINLPSHPDVINEAVKSQASSFGKSDLKEIESMVGYISSLPIEVLKGYPSRDWKSIPFKELFSNVV